MLAMAETERERASFERYTMTCRTFLYNITTGKSRKINMFNGFSVKKTPHENIADENQYP